MSEKGIQEGIQTVIQGMDEFAYSDVTINDWTVLDESGSKAPYVVIEESDTFGGRQGALTADTNWEVVVNLYYYVADKTWKAGLDGFRDTRQALLDKFNEVGNARTAGGLEATSIDEIRPLTPIGYVYHSDVDPDIDVGAMPIFVMQVLEFVVREF